jgi:lysophospholipase L1-like esterase
VSSGSVAIRTKLLFSAATIGLTVVLSAAALLAVDVYLHSRVQDQGSVNVWGYRGPTVGRKQPGETRVVVLGGSTAFGYGVRWTEAVPYYLEQMLNARIGRSQYRVINLGAPGQGALGFRYDLADYAYLRYDIAVFYEGYNDLGRTDLPNAVPPRDAPNDLLWRRQSPVFRATGYLPVLPLVFREKAMVLMAGGDLDAAYRGRAVFRPGLAARATAGALKAAAAIADSVGATVGTLTSEAAKEHAAAIDTAMWRHYTDRVVDAVSFARKRSIKVLVVTQPYASDSHVAQQRALAQALAVRFRDDAGVKYVNLGLEIDLRDRSIAYDGLHLVAKGNERIARRLVEPILALRNPS